MLTSPALTEFSTLIDFFRYCMNTSRETLLVAAKQYQIALKEYKTFVFLL